MRRVKEDIEFYPNDEGKVSARQVRDGYKTSFTHNKLSEPEMKKYLDKPTEDQLDVAKAAFKYLKAKGKEKDVSSELNLSPAPDLTFKGNGDVEVTPDNGKASYRISAKELEKYENRSFKKANKIEEKTDLTSIPGTLGNVLLVKHGRDLDRIFKTPGSQASKLNMLMGNLEAWKSEVTFKSGPEEYDYMLKQLENCHTIQQASMIIQNFAIAGDAGCRAIKTGYSRRYAEELEAKRRAVRIAEAKLRLAKQALKESEAKIR